MHTYIIVGGVAGGAGTAARLRRLDETCRIIMFERGAYISYANCGLPYYAGNTITDRSRLFVITAQEFQQTFNVEVHTEHEVIAIDREAKTVTVKNLKDGSELNCSYDTLVLSPGAAPFKLNVPGADDKAIFPVRSVSDIDAVVAKLQQPNVSNAVVVGGGFIGLEMAENLKERHMQVTVVEALDQVMNVIDYDMAAIIQQHLRDKGVRLIFKDGVKSFSRTDKGLIVKLMSGTELNTDLVILSIGVRPDTAIAQKANLELGRNGAIKVDQYFTTSDPSIKAVGDAIEYPSPISGLPVSVPLAGPANKQARLCADAIVKGTCRPYRGTIATSIAKVFDMAAASTGLTGKQLTHAGIEYVEVVTHAGNHAGYYPGSRNLTAKILFSPVDGKLYGGQVVGYAGVDKRIDVIAAYISKDGTIDDLADFEQAYAPPFSSAKDPVNMLGFIARNHIDGSGKTITWKQISQLKEGNAVLLDVRTEDEHELGAIEGSLNIPHTQLRSRLSEIPADRPVVVYCSVGLRGYVAQRLLLQNGFREVINLTGGYKTWEVVKEEIKQLQGEYMQKEKESTESAAYDYSRKLDACGLQCPGPIIQLKKEVDRMAAGERVLVSATDPGFAKDVRSWCNLTGNRLISFTNDSGGIEAIIEKATALSATSGNQQVQVKQNPSATLIVFSNDMDKALASFVLANGAAATGQQVTMFFTFWGLSILRKRNPGKVSKDFMGKMFGMMLPKGMDKLSLSKMNMVGMGPLMMKSRMRSKRVDQLSEMFAQAKASGVRFVACQMSMDIMGIKAEELLDGIEIGGVATYMEAAAVSTVNLFI